MITAPWPAGAAAATPASVVRGRWPIRTAALQAALLAALLAALPAVGSAAGSAVGSAVGPAAGAASPDPAGGPPRTLAVANSLYAAPVLVAEALGYFAAEGLPLNTTRCTVGRICLQQLLDGRSQFATVADTPIALASFARRDFSIIGTTTVSGSELRLLARQDRGIRGATDLRGRRVGFVPGTSAHYYLETFLLFHGLKASELTLVPLQVAQAAAALVRGEVDAAALFEPAGRDAVRQLGPLALALPGPGFFTLTFNLVSAGRGAGVTAQDEVRLLRAVRRAEALIRAEPERARSLLAGVLQMDPVRVQEAWGDFAFRLHLGQPLVHTLEAQARWALREGLAPAGVRAPNVLDLINVEPLRRVDPQAMRLVR